MNLVVYCVVPVLILVTACQKEEYEQPLLSSNARDTVWNLSLQIPELGIAFSVDASERKTLYGSHTVPVGNHLIFISSPDSVTVTVGRHYDGTIALFTGAIK